MSTKEDTINCGETTGSPCMSNEAWSINFTAYHLVYPLFVNTNNRLIKILVDTEKKIKEENRHNCFLRCQNLLKLGVLLHNSSCERFMMKLKFKYLDEDTNIFLKLALFY